MTPQHDSPFLAPHHHSLVTEIVEWARHEPGIDGDEADPPGRLRQYAASLGAAGLLRHVVPDPESKTPLDVRAIVVVREVLAYYSGLADVAFALQGIAAAPIASLGTAEIQHRFLPGIRSGSVIAAFALSEPQGGSDVSAITTTATRDGDDFVLNGKKSWISNGDVAALHVVFARTSAGAGSRGLSAFIVEAGQPGLEVTPVRTLSEHPLATLRFHGCRVKGTALLGELGSGFRAAMANLDMFRPTVGATALGFARRALDEAVQRACDRRMFGQSMADMEAVQMQLADMYADVQCAALSVYRAAWAKDVGAGRTAELSAMAKLVATEAAKRVVDSAVQIFGAQGVARGCVVERLYREVRALRIGEGASEIQKLIIARRMSKTNSVSIS